MSRLHDLFRLGGQSPWVDDLHREWLDDGHLEALVDDGVRGITSNPTIFAKAITESSSYDAALFDLLVDRDVESAYWELVIDDIERALRIMRPVFDSSGGHDGFVSLEVAPSLAYTAEGTFEAAQTLHRRIDQPNLLVKVPATADGLVSLRRLFAAGHSINVTLIFGLARYDQVIDAYISGLEDHIEAGCEDLSHINSVASFFVSRTDTEVDARLTALGSTQATELRGRAAVSLAQVAYQHFATAFQTERWRRLEALGARVQRPLWASTSTKDLSYPDLLYVDSLIGPHTVNTMPTTTLSHFIDHGTIARTVDADPSAALANLSALAAQGIDLSDVADVLERQGVASFARSFDDLLLALSTKATSR